MTPHYCNYADDINIARNVRNKDQVTMELQKEFDKITEWSVAGQSNVTLDTSRWRSLALTVPNQNGKPRWLYQGLCCNHSPTFLGVSYGKSFPLVNMSTNSADP